MLENVCIYKYSCAMLQLNAQMSNLIRVWADLNIPKSLLYIDLHENIYGYEYNPHISIKYGIHDPTPANLINIIKGIKPIDISLGQIEIFDTNPLFDVLKIDVYGEGLHNLNKVLSNKLQHTDKYVTYRPHITIAYTKKHACNKFLHNTTFDKLTDTVSVIHFNSKSGKDYYINM